MIRLRRNEVKNSHLISTTYLVVMLTYYELIVVMLTYYELITLSSRSAADPKLPNLLKMLMWAQDQLDEKAAYPRINDLSTAMLEDPPI